jgi:hypothetical protein
MQKGGRSMPSEIFKLLQFIAGEKLMADALEIVRDRLELTPDKLALMVVRLINPDEILGEQEEAKVRGVSRNTLRDMKGRGELPVIIQSPVNRQD